MPSPSADPSARERRLGEVLLAYLEQAQAGRAPDPETWLAQHAEFAAELAEFLAARDEVERLVAPARSDTPVRRDRRTLRPRGMRTVPAVPFEPGWDISADGSSPGTDLPAVGQVGEFLLLREIGRGGMGIVYEARQQSLNRRVALKVLPFAAAFDPRQLQRFKNEAQAAAQLHHTSIVPVYAVGSERGVHYYAMQFIDGQSLAAVIAARRQSQAGSEPDRTERAAGDRTAPVPAGASAGTIAPARYFFRLAAQLTLKAAEALEHAHQYGIVHRDIKPANLLVDSRGELWVTDFGLAQFQSELGLTLTGEVLGTLRYMSPEQALAKKGLVDHRTDIYSLGVTLYELLTLRPAFDARDRHDLLRQVAFEEPRPLRQLQKAVPAELETIVLKAMAKEPAERYASARELADDLRRFLQDKPVQARRPGAWVKAMKWCRRHRTIVGSAAVLLAASVIGLFFTTLIIAHEHARTKEAYRREQQKAREAGEQRALAQESFLQARRAVDFFTLVSEEDLAQKPQLRRMRKKLLEAALVYHQDFVRRQQDTTDPALQAEVASSRYRVGRILSELGSKVDALAELEQARDGMERLRRGHPESREYRLWLALIHGALSSLQGCKHLVLLSNPAVLDDLEMTTEQRQEVAALSERLAEQRRQALRDLHTLSPSDQGRWFKELTAANAQALGALLTPAQSARLRQVALQQQGALAFNNHHISELLALTDAQKEQLAEIHEMIFDGVQQRLRREGTAREGRECQAVTLRESAQTRMLAVLTEEQQARWTELTGPPLADGKHLGPPLEAADPYLLLLLH